MPNYCVITCLLLLLIVAPVAAETAGGASPLKAETGRLVTGNATAPGSNSPKAIKELNSAIRDMPAPRGESNGVVKLFLFMIIAIAALLLAILAVRTVRYLTLGGLKKMRIQKFKALSPMVTRSLRTLATSLWGENHLWSTHYCILEKNDRWLLQDRKRHYFTRSVQERNCLEVCMKDTNLRVKIYLLNGTKANVVMECSGFSEPGWSRRYFQAMVQKPFCAVRQSFWPGEGWR